MKRPYLPCLGTLFQHVLVSVSPLIRCVYSNVMYTFNHALFAVLPFEYFFRLPLSFVQKEALSEALFSSTVVILQIQGDRRSFVFLRIAEHSTKI